MTYVTPLPLDAITDPEMLELIAQARAVGVPDDLFPRIISRAPEQAKPIMRAMLMSFTQGNVDHRLKEIIRVLLARFANEKYFASLRSRKAQAMGLTEQRIDEGCNQYEDDAKEFSEAEKWALRFADLLYLDHTHVNKEFYDNLKKHWTEAQIMELGSFVVCHYGMQMTMRALGGRTGAA